MKLAHATINSAFPEEICRVINNNELADYVVLLSPNITINQTVVIFRVPDNAPPLPPYLYG